MLTIRAHHPQGGIMLDTFLAPDTLEATAHHHLTDKWPYWQTGQPSEDEALIANCASYRAFSRYLSGRDLFLLPKSHIDLERILRRYAQDAIHNAISTSRSVVQTGGYSRMCEMAAQSIRDVLNADDNAEKLFKWHQSLTSDHNPDDCVRTSHLNFEITI